ncbi:hypothetical protein Tco_0946832 [Tanacetum coccineum]
MPTTTNPINTTTTTNAAQRVVNENLPQLLDSRGGSHVTNVHDFDKEDFTSWKVRFLGLIVESFDWDEDYVSSEDEGTTRIRAFMAIAKDEPSVGKDDTRSGQWVDITMKKNEVIRVNIENESLRDEISDLKNIIEKWTCSKVTLDQLLSEQIPGNIVKALGGKGRRKENNPSKKVMFNKANVSTSESAPMITSNSKDDSDIQKLLPPLPKLTGADPSGASKSLISLSDLTANMDNLTLNTASKEIKKSSNKVSQTYVIKKRTESKHPAVQTYDYLKRSEWYLDSGCSRHMIGVKQYLHRYSKEPGPKVVFGVDSSRDTKGYGLVNCNGITFTRLLM